MSEVLKSDELSDTQRDFLRFELQRAKIHEDAKSLQLDQLSQENGQLKLILSEMRKELDTLRERGGGQQSAQTIFELRRELYKLQAEKKSVELEKEFLEQSAREA